MTTPHEIATDAMSRVYGEGLSHEEEARRVIKALREGAVERLHVARHEKLGDRVAVEQLTDREIINAVLGEPKT